MSGHLLTLLKSNSRGIANHGWLNSFHTFSFASYQNPKYNGYGEYLRVINEDRVTPTKGFAPHSHENFEIFSYVISGQIAHKDSMGHSELIGRGGVQYTTAVR
jgi:hypothetical protein